MSDLFQFVRAPEWLLLLLECSTILVVYLITLESRAHNTRERDTTLNCAVIWSSAALDAGGAIHTMSRGRDQILSCTKRVYEH